MSETTGELHIPQWTLADRLDKTLRDARLSTASMAEYLEVHRNTVVNWIGGRTKPPATAVKLWAMRVGVPYEWLAHGIVAEQAQSTIIPPRSRHRLRHLGRDLDGAPTIPEILALRKELHGDRRGSIERRRNARVTA